MDTIALVTGATVTPVTLAEAKAHLRVDVSDDDALIGALVEAATMHVESITGRGLVSQTWDYSIDAFPADDETITLPRSPVLSVTSITYADAEGDAQTMDSEDYRVISGGADKSRVGLVYGGSWPLTQGITHAVTVRFVAGYADGSASPFDNGQIPAPIRQAILLMVGHWYENRSASVIGVSVATLPMAVDALLTPYRSWWVV